MKSHGPSDSGTMSMATEGYSSTGNVVCMTISALVVGRCRGGSVGHVLLDAIALGDERPLENDATLLVPLALLGGKLVHPA